MSAADVTGSVSGLHARYLVKHSLSGGAFPVHPTELLIQPLSFLGARHYLIITFELEYSCGLSRWFSGKESPASAGDAGSIPGSGRFPREGNGNPLQYSCLGDHRDRGAWRQKSQT